MGSIDQRIEPVTLADLARCSHIAVIRPDEPALRLEDRVFGGAVGGPDRPAVAPVPYRVGFDRVIVDYWLRGTGPARLELPLKSNEDAVRDAADRSRGMFGHVHHVVIERRLQGEGAHLLRQGGQRIVFLTCMSFEPDATSFREAFPGIGLAMDALPVVTAAIPAPEPPQRSRSSQVVLVVLVAMMVAGLGLLVMSQL
jgi:hypothetical protein